MVSTFFYTLFASYVERIRWLEVFGKRVIWIDETNFNLYCTRQRGRSIQGSRVRIPVANSKGRNLHIIGAIDSSGLVRYTCKRGSFTAAICNNWMTELLTELSAQTSDSCVIVCDNAPCHSKLESVFSSSQFQLLRLGPYSPALNPIEIIWSVVKSKIKERMSITYDRILLGDPENRISKQEWRMRHLEEIALEAKTAITAELCSNAIRHVHRSYESVLMGGEI